MARKALPYRLVSEKSRSGKRIWRAYFYCPETKKYDKKSTMVVDDGSKRAQIEANRVAAELLEVRLHGPSSVSPIPVFDQLASTFWVWGVSPYLKARLARDKDALSPEYVATMESCYRVHAKAFIGHLTLTDITPDVLDSMVTTLLERDLAPQTVKHVLYSVSPVFKWAVRRRFLKYNPVPSMLEFSPRVKNRRDAFSLEEARALLSVDRIPAVWVPPVSITKTGKRANYHPSFKPWRNYALSLLAAVTGARVSSILAVRREDIELHKHGEKTFYVVTLKHSLARIRGIKPGSKTDSGTEVPVACEILEQILPHLPSKGFLFPSWGRHGVLTSNAALRSLKSAMAAIGIHETERRARNLRFHSWRHTWVTRARAAGLSEAVRSGFTEHKDEKTSGNYTHLRAVDLLEALPIQRAFLVG